MAEKVIAIYHADGTTEIKVEGTAGPSCATRQHPSHALARALGVTVSDTPTAEYHQHAPAAIKQR